MTIPSLTDAELAVMALLWDADALTAREIQERLYPDAERSQHGTVQKLLKRMEDKGFVYRDRSPAVGLFSARIDRDEYAGRQLESLADRVTGGSLAPMLTHLVEENRLTPAEIRKLREILEEA